MTVGAVTVGAVTVGAIAIGYRWFETALGFHLDRALRDIGAQPVFVGIGAPGHPGCDSDTPIPTVLEGLAKRPSVYLWIDPAGRYFPPDIEDADALTAAYIVDAHLGHWRESAARFFDVVFLAQKRYVEPYKRALGHDQVFWLPLGAAADVHRDHGLARIYDVAFIGNIDRAHRGTSRARRLALLASRYKTNGFSQSAMPDAVGRVYSQAKIVFNASISGDVTMRLFEGAACGALVLSDAPAPDNGCDDLLRPGVEYATYADDADLIAKVDYYLANADERARIASAGQARVLGEHTYGHRARQLMQTLGAAAMRQAAPMRRAPANERLRARLTVYTHLHMLDAVFDATRGLNPARRLWLAAPCLARRVTL